MSTKYLLSTLFVTSSIQRIMVMIQRLLLVLKVYCYLRMLAELHRVCTQRVLLLYSSICPTPKKLCKGWRLSKLKKRPFNPHVVEAVQPGQWIGEWMEPFCQRYCILSFAPRALLTLVGLTLLHSRSHSGSLHCGKSLLHFLSRESPHRKELTVPPNCPECQHRHTPTPPKTNRAPLVAAL